MIYFLMKGKLPWS